MPSQSANLPKSKLIYLDVSSTAVSPIVTGIPRVVRSLAEERNRSEVHLIEFDGLANSYKSIQELQPLNTSSESLQRTRRALIATKLYKALTENENIGSVVTFLLRSRFIFYVARRLLGAPSGNGEMLNQPNGILFLPEVPVHKWHVTKIMNLKKSGAITLALYVHDLLPIHHPEYFSRDLVWKFRNFVPLIEVADVILVSNEDVKAQVEAEFKKSQVHVVALPSTYIQTTPTSELSSRFLMVGTIEPRKNYMSVLESFEKLHVLHPEIELRIVGNLGWKYTDIVTRISRLQHRGVKLHWLQNLNDEELRLEYQQALALLYPSHYEGYGLPIIEALSQSTPVITSDRPAMRLFERLGGVTLINPDNSDELFDEMKRMLDFDYRKSKSQQIQLNEIPTSWQVFAHHCYQTIREV